MDECPGCGGIWLDPGELKAIVTEFRSPEERQRAFDKYFYETFGERLAPLIRSRLVKNTRAHLVGHVLYHLGPPIGLVSDGHMRELSRD